MAVCLVLVISHTHTNVLAELYCYCQQQISYAGIKIALQG